jgi:lipoprotein-releasing system permease protein
VGREPENIGRKGPVRIEIVKLTNAKWIGFVAGRYVSRGRKNSPSAVFSILGIATGVLALTVILSVMNGFQLGFIESILEMSSYHVRIENFPSGAEGERLAAAVRSIPGVVSVLPFREINGLIRGEASSPRGAAARGLPPDALDRDGGLRSRLVFESGSFDLASKDSVVLGAELARHLGLRRGDKVSLLSITGNLAANFGGEGEEADPSFTITGIFRCGFYEYDLGWAFINIDRAGELTGEGQLPGLGIKIKNRWQDRRVRDETAGILKGMGYGEGGGAPEGLEPGKKAPRVSSWRDYNRAFFGALRTEKLMMFILVGLIFVVVGLNIFQAQRRSVLERREEIGLLRALGAEDAAVRLIFVWDGFIIGLSGAGLGLLLGLLTAFHIPAVFGFLESGVNALIRFLNSAAALAGFSFGAGDFAVFSPRTFYIKEIPSRVIAHEVLLIFMFGFLSALLAAWSASGKVSGTRPAEVLRYE